MDKDKVLNKIYDYIDDHRDDMLKSDPGCLWRIGVIGTDP